MRIRDDHDGAWKEIIGDFLGALLAMLLPKLHAAIDWAAPVEFLDTELRAAVQGPRGGRLHCDRLARVHRRDGKGELLLLHMEVQGRRERGFAGRMFDYWSRIRARMGHAPVSVALLAGRGAWRTCGGTYRWRDHGCALRFDYVAVDLSDMDLGPWLARGNVVAHLIKAHRLAMETRGRPTPRMEGKVGVTRALLGMGLKGRQLNRAMRAVNWLLALPEAKELEFQERLGKLEGGKAMGYVTTYDRLVLKQARQAGIEEGMAKARKTWHQKGHVEGLKAGRTKGRMEGRLAGIRDTLIDSVRDRFGSVPRGVRSAVAKQADEATLRGWLRASLRMASIRELEEHVRHA